MKESWLHCTLAKGMFSDEFVVQTSSGQSFFIPKDKIQEENPEKGKVRVRVLERGGTTWAVMPTEDAAVIQVKKEELERIGR